MEGHRLGVLLWICVCVLDGVAATCPSGKYGYMCSYQCHCPPDKCHTTFGCQSANCFLGWSGPTCEKENIAFNKSTTSSDGYPYPSSNAVDGDTKRNDDTKCILSAYNDASITSAWWRVDLGQKTLIHDVIIYFRTGFKVRRNGIQIYIADTDASPTDGVNCYNVTGNRDGTDISDVLNVTCSGEGRYLVLYTTTVNNEINNVNVPVLDFCEVEVDATCPSGKYGYMCSYQCHCPPDKCHTTFGCQSANCFLGWSGPTCEKENIAFNKSTTSSDGYTYPSSNAVDGDTKRNDDTKCILSAYNDASITSAWWRVDLGQKTLIHDVIIYFRTGYIVRRNGIQIYIADTAASPTDGVNCYNVTGNRDGTDISDVLNVTCSGEGRYLVLYTTTVNNEINNVNVPVLDFCEVEVDVCDFGSYGTNCTQTCSNRNCKGDNSSCDHVAGECVRGCTAGWNGTDCTDVCDDGSYGTNCTQTCSNRNCKGNNSICDHVTGKCAEGCIAGWNGTDCTHECVNSYGESCAHLCSSRNCSGSSSCNHVTGQCENGCIPGWKDTDCREVCDFGSYGTNCTQTCSNRNCKGDNSSCDHVAGECVGGCTAGWNGTDCTHVCDDGSYGSNCTQTCSNRNCKGNNSICDHVTGKCAEGCIAGWNGTDCTHECVNSYGESCAHLCSSRNCSGSSSCNHVTGQCENGCIPGWKDTDCREVCDFGSYGTNCTQTCSNRNCKGDNSRCDHVAGECVGGCTAGWNGTDCTHECVNSYGESCAHLCSSRNCSGSSSCNHVTGQCENGCIPGWKDTDCREVCDFGSYGTNCTQTCSNRNCKGDNSSCDHVAGECVGGCTAGWNGTDCTHVCDDGSYGSNCTQTCSNRNCKGNNSICDHVTGKCAEGCIAGWNGTDCTHECVNSYGESCAHLCSSRNCSGSSSCNHVTGQCENGCIPGWKDTDCREVCDFGSYGTNCTQTCSNRNCKGDNSRCDHVAGECVGGCTAGWNGTDCTHECVNSYGESCAHLCSSRNCSGSSSCNHVTGQCENGCIPGWKDTDCREVCDFGSYGTNCTQTCSNRNCKGDNSRCDHVAGECVGVCTAGWNGTDCTHECIHSYGEGCAYLCSSRKCSGTALCNHVTGQCENGCIPGWKNTDCRESMSMPSPQNTGAIVGSIVAVLAVAAIIVVVIVLRRRRSHSKHENDADMFEIQKVGGTQSKGVDNPRDNDVVVEGEAHNDVEEDHNDTYYNIARALPVTVVSVDQLGERIQELQVPVGGFQAEYQKLSNTFTRPYNDSQLEENKGKNKYISYYPYDATRVVLTELPGRPGSDYINASYIHGYSRPKAYIAAQAPTTMTLPDFWRMIWEQNCTRIVMLTNLMELGRVKCEAYWCDTLDINAGDLTVTVTNSSIRAHWVVRELQVTESKTNTTRCFYHFHFTTWPDHGTPEETALTEFLWLVRTSYNTKDDPLLVHCSAGVGRTGTYIAVDYLLDQALTDRKVDVFGCISGMRDQRKGLIQTKEQYRCVYMALFETLKFGNTSISAEEFRSSRRVRGVFNIGRMAINKLIKTLNTQREELSKGTPDKGRVWIDGRSDILSVMSRSHLSVKGYLLTEAPSVTTASLFWKLMEEQESSTVIVLPDSHQSLSNFVPCPGDSLDLDHVSVRCSTETTINRDITLLKIQRQVKNSPPTVVRVYILNILPAESPSTFLELLEQVDRHTGNVNPLAVTVLYSDGGKQNGAMLCIMSNIIQGVKHDKRVEIYNNMRAMTHCLDQDITQTEVALCYDMASAYIESQIIYANM